ncbi:MAG: trehalose-phosphatase, partial [Actinomycetota bacterium]|nr:trehalose-phosphatase [Actinomycetota bacterium]
MTSQASVRELPDALGDGERFRAKLAGRRPAVFLDYDGVLTPIVDRPEDARVTEETKAELRRLVGRYALVACVTGRPPEV